MMITRQTKLEGRKLFEERLVQGEKYIIYRSEHDARTHAFMDGHTHLTHYCSSSPRLFFTSTKGSSGKTRTTQLSYFFVANPIMATASGASLIWDFNAAIVEGNGTLPTVLYDEAQDAWKPPGNENVQALFGAYLKGFPRTVWDGAKAMKQELFCSVIMNGLTTKYDIHPNFFERCIQVPLFKRLDCEHVEDFEFGDLVEEIGDGFRAPRAEWSGKFTKDDIKAIRKTVSEELKSEGITSRDAELWKPLCEYAYLCGDDIFEMAIDAAIYSLEKRAQQKKYTLKEELLIDIHSIFSDKRLAFIKSEDVCIALNAMEHRPWKTYKGKELNQHNLAFLLKDYEIGPEKDVTQRMRGYYIHSFKNAWERDLALKTPVVNS